MKDYARIRARRAKLADIRATERQRTERARRKAMGIALIQRPLRFIGDKTNTVTLVDGKPKMKASPQFQAACIYASHGFGLGVQGIARQVLRSLA